MGVLFHTAGIAVAGMLMVFATIAGSVMHMGRLFFSTGHRNRITNGGTARILIPCTANVNILLSCPLTTSPREMIQFADIAIGFVAFNPFAPLPTKSCTILSIACYIVRVRFLPTSDTVLSMLSMFFFTAGYVAGTCMCMRILAANQKYRVAICIRILRTGCYVYNTSDQIAIIFIVRVFTPEYDRNFCGISHLPHRCISAVLMGHGGGHRIQRAISRVRNAVTVGIHLD